MKENKRYLFHKWNIILFVFSALLIECSTFLFNGLGFLPKYFLIDFACILFFVVILMIIPNNIADIVIASIILILQIAIAIANSNLLLITGEVFAWDMLSVIHEATQAVGEGIGFSIGYVLISIPILITYILFSIRLLIYMTKGEAKPKRNWTHFKKHSLLTVIVCLVSLLMFNGQKIYIENIPTSEDTMINDKYLYDTFYSHQEGFKKFGTFGYYLISGIRSINEHLISKNSHQRNLRQNLDKYFQKNSNKNNQNDFTGISNGNNLIYILWETGDFSGINEDLTPNLYYLFTNGLALNEYYGKDQTNISEGKFLFGSYPSEGFLNYNFLKNSYPFTLPNRFRDTYGDKSQIVSFHNNRGTYYKRNTSHLHFGFDDHVSMEDMKIEPNPDFWINRDSEMFKIATEETENNIPLMVPMNSDVPFFTYVATFSTHGPFEGRLNEEKVSEDYYNHYAQLKEKLDAYLLTHPNPVNYLGYPLLLDENTDPQIVEMVTDIDEKYNEHAKEYLLGAMDLDQGIGSLLEALRREDRLHDTTIAILSDHYGYYHEYAFTSKGLNKKENVNNPEAYHIPGILYDEKLVDAIKQLPSEKLSQYHLSYTTYEYTQDTILGSDKFFTNIDMAPTLMNLFDIPYDSALYLGNDLFNEDYSFINSRKGGIFDNQFYTEDGTDITNLDPDYLLYVNGDKKNATPEELAYYNEYEQEQKEFIMKCSDFIIKSYYLNTLYECDYFSYRSMI